MKAIPPVCTRHALAVAAAVLVAISAPAAETRGRRSVEPARTDVNAARAAKLRQEARARGGEEDNAAAGQVQLGVRVAAAEPFIQTVVGGSPAAKAGVQAGDLILQLDGKAVASVDDVLTLIHKQGNGSHPLVVQRGNQQIRYVLRLSAKPDQAQMGIRLRHGVRVIDAPAGSPGAKAGLKPGDVIHAINGNRFNGMPALQNMLRRANPAAPVQLGVFRDAQLLELEVAPDSGWLAASRSKEDGHPAEPDARSSYTPPADLARRLQEINVLQTALVDPRTGRLVLIGYYDPAYPSGPLPYRELLADALAHPSPAFSLEFPGLNDPALARIRATFNQEHARLSRDPEYGLEWMRSLILPLLTGGGDPEGRLALDGRLRAAGTSLEAYEAYYRWQESRFTENRWFPGAQDFLGALFAAAGRDPAAGRSAAAHRLLASAQTYDHFDFWALQTGRHDFFRRNRQEVENGRNREDANAELLAELYTTMLRLMGASDTELHPLAAALRAGRSDEQPFLRIQERIMNETLRSFLSRRVVNGMTFSGASLGARYHLPPLRSSLNTFGAPRDSALMQAFFAADYTLKHLGSSARAVAEVPDHVTTQQFLAAAGDRAGAAAGRVPTSGVVRHWLQPAEVRIEALPHRGGLRFRDAAVRIASEPLEVAGADARGAAFHRETLRAYGDFLTQRLDRYARVYPSLHVLRETAKVIALARWARGAGLALDVQAQAGGDDPLPSHAEGFWGLTCLVRATGETDALVLWAQGGVTFDQKTGDDWIRLETPAGGGDTLQQLAASVAFAERAVGALDAGELEQARELAEQSAQAMTGRIDVSRLTGSVPLPAGPEAASLAEQAALLQQTVAEIEHEAGQLRDLRAQRAAAAPLEQSNPAEYTRLAEQARLAEARSAEKLRQLRDHLRRFRRDSAAGAPPVVDLTSTSGSIGLLRPAAPAISASAAPLPPELVAQAPRPGELRAELARLRAELETLKASLGRLNRSIQTDQEQFAQWEAEAAGAIERAEERAKEFVKDQLQDAFLGWAEHYFTTVQPSPDRLRDIKAAKDLMDLQEFREWAERKDEGFERVVDGVGLLADKLPIADKLKDLIGAVDSSIESAFDISAWLASWRRINQLEKNSDAFLEAVSASGARMRKIVTRIKTIEDQLASAAPPRD